MKVIISHGIELIFTANNWGRWKWIRDKEEGEESTLWRFILIIITSLRYPEVALLWSDIVGRLNSAIGVVFDSAINLLLKSKAHARVMFCNIVCYVV